MRRLAFLLLTALLLTTGALYAQAPAANANHDLGYDDTPQLPGLPFHVHDPQRPHPPVVTPSLQPGGAPSDAIVLFDGKDLSQWQTPQRGNWKVANGYLEVAPGAGDLETKQKFGSMQLHIEWAAPVEIRGNSQNRGNSGIFLQGRYEIQVLDSDQNPTYADGQAGAIYGQWPPLANATRKPGEWQIYDIVFEAPVFSGGTLVKPAYATVFLNGVLLHNHKELMGATVHRQLAKYTPHGDEALVLQDHQQPVRYRNIWIRRLDGYDQPEK